MLLPKTASRSAIDRQTFFHHVQVELGNGYLLLWML